MLTRDFVELRAREFGRLDRTHHAYLDYTGAALYPVSLVDEHASLLRDVVLGNPHSESQASLASSALLAEARGAVSRFFHADDYEVVFTANATAAIRLVAESFPFDADSSLVLSSDNHNSVNGIREYATRAGASVDYLPLDSELRLDTRGAPSSGGLFAFPAQSNFSGLKHPLALIGAAQSVGYRVLLDAASYAATSTLDLDVVKPDFVALSFYKMFGYPTGIGALLVRRDALNTLRRPWFSGGTVEHVTVADRRHMLLPGAEGFEDGTVNFLGLSAVTSGLRWLSDVGVERIGSHAGMLARRLWSALGDLRHRNGAPMVARYGPSSWRARGAVVAFNVIDSNGDTIPHEEVEARAREMRVSIRGGCFCNPGAAEAVGVGFGSRTPGALRASLGAASSESDVGRLVEVVADVATRRDLARIWTASRKEIHELAG